MPLVRAALRGRAVSGTLGNSMWGRHLKNWFGLFCGIAVFHPKKGGGHDDGTWLAIQDIIGRFVHSKLTFEGNSVQPNDDNSNDRLTNAIINNAGALCHVKLLERRRTMQPPAVLYRPSRIGRAVDSWRGSDGPDWRQGALFFLLEIYFRVRKLRWILTAGALAWAALNAAKFYGVLFQGMAHSLFAVASAVCFVAFLLLLLVLRSD